MEYLLYAQGEHIRTMNNNLSKIIAEIWNRANRVFPRITGARILRFLIHSDDGFTLEEVDKSADHIPYPAKWAPDSGQSLSVNARWLGGQWGSGTASPGDVGTADYVLAEHWNNLLDEFQNHNHDGTHGALLVNDSFEDGTLMTPAFAGGPTSVFLQPSISFKAGSASLIMGDETTEYAANPIIALLYPGTAFYGFSPPDDISFGSVEYSIFYGAPGPASGVINFSYSVCQSGSCTTYSDSFEASVGNPLLVKSGTIDNLNSFEIRIQKDSSPSPDPLWSYGVFIKIYTRP